MSETLLEYLNTVHLGRRNLIRVVLYVDRFLQFVIILFTVLAFFKKIFSYEAQSLACRRKILVGIMFDCMTSLLMSGDVKYTTQAIVLLVVIQEN